LGDRHGENILFDCTTGDAVHVDFNCLFFKGLTFEKPEKVPFRLTPNMVDAMGLSGYEGVFRRVCELTLGVLRNNRETLMSVLETFIHDPLVEWTKDSKKMVINIFAVKIDLKFVLDSFR
jgi:serine/threonine-protein kinase ATR